MLMVVAMTVFSLFFFNLVFLYLIFLPFVSLSLSPFLLLFLISLSYYKTNLITFFSYLFLKVNKHLFSYQFYFIILLCFLFREKFYENRNRKISWWFTKKYLVFLVFSSLFVCCVCVRVCSCVSFFRLWLIVWLLTDFCSECFLVLFESRVVFW